MRSSGAKSLNEACTVVLYLCTVQYFEAMFTSRYLHNVRTSTMKEKETNTLPATRVIKYHTCHPALDEQPQKNELLTGGVSQWRQVIRSHGSSTLMLVSRLLLSMQNRQPWQPTVSRRQGLQMAITSGRIARWRGGRLPNVLLVVAGCCCVIAFGYFL